mmetsp:Transcript_29690/g.88081  ORF Transcript_29690/g.88081 Transcript_29690/m.88081 type:complete len:267 (+) Transcript_29690:1204-2004(+)
MPAAENSSGTSPRPCPAYWALGSTSRCPSPLSHRTILNRANYRRIVCFSPSPSPRWRPPVHWRRHCRPRWTAPPNGATAAYPPSGCGEATILRTRRYFLPGFRWRVRPRASAPVPTPPPRPSLQRRRRASSPRGWCLLIRCRSAGLPCTVRIRRPNAPPDRDLPRCSSPWYRDGATPDRAPDRRRDRSRCTTPRLRPCTQISVRRRRPTCGHWTDSPGPSSVTRGPNLRGISTGGWCCRGRGTRTSGPRGRWNKRSWNGWRLIGRA